MKRNWRRWFADWPLTRQLATILAAVMVLCAVLIISSNEAWWRFEQQRTIESLPPQMAQAYRDVEQNRLPKTDDLLGLIKANNALAADAIDRSNIMLTILVMGGVVIAFGLGYVLLGGIGKGLDDVGRAAREIASGNLSARAKTVSLASREELQLAQDFNQMANSLQGAQRELGESTAALAHELRTPLTILRGRLHGIADGVFGLEPSEIKGLILQVEGLGRIVDDLMTLSLSNSGRMILDCQSIDLADQVTHVLTAMRPDLERAGLDAHLDLTRTIVSADATRVRQIISAVLSNAIRYAPNSGTLEIVTRHNERHVILQISDNGPGLPEGAESRAFDRFWLGEPSRARISGGSGLGLAVVRSIVEAHGGCVALSNRPAIGGATFEMLLPVSA